MPSQVQVINGSFEDAAGNVLANGHLDLVLSQDGVVPGVGQICAGLRVRIQLDENGNAVSNPQQLVWGNDQLSPINSYYAVSGFRANGERVWGPHNQQITGSTPFNLNNWVPNVLSSWTPSPQSVLFEVNGVKTGSQTLVNLVAGANTTVSDNGSGTWTVASSGGGGGSVTLQTNGVNNGSQTLLNLVAGTNITITDNGSGSITITSSASGGIGTLFGANFNTVIGAGPRTDYSPIIGVVAGTTTPGPSSVILAANGTAKNMFFTTSSTQPSTGSIVMSLYDTTVGAATALVVTIAANAVAGTFNSGATTASVIAGHLYCLQHVNNATSNSATITGWGFQVQ